MAEIYTNEKGKIMVEVPVFYTVFNRASMEFDSIEEMNEKLYDHEFVQEMPLGDEPDHSDGTYEIDFDLLDAEVAAFEEENGGNQ